MRSDPFELDRAVARAVAAEQRKRRMARSDPTRAHDLPAWFEGVRHVAGKTAFDETASLATTDPFRAPLRRWIHRLAVTRIAEPFLDRLDDTWREPRIRADALGNESYGARDAIGRALADANDARREAWIEALAKCANPVSLATLELRDAAIEIRGRLGAPTNERIEIPVDVSILKRSATTFLDATSALTDVASGSARSFSTLLGNLVARDAPGDWPRRPSGRWLADVFGGTPLLEGIELDPGPFTSTLGAASFARALARFGASYRRAAAPTSSPFVLAHDATEVEPLRRGALFATLMLEPSFLRRHAGLSREHAGDAIRIVARSMLIHLRLEATWALLSRRGVPFSDIDDAIALAIGFEPARGLALVLPRPHRFAEARFIAALLANADRRALIQKFDEDWFRNPRALEWLRGCDGSILTEQVVLQGNESELDALCEREASRLASDLETLAG